MKMNRSMFVLSIILLLGACEERPLPPPQVSEIRSALCMAPSAEYKALENLYNKNTGWSTGVTSTWLTSCNVCTWQGVSCDGLGRVSLLELSNEGITEVPKETLPSLRYLLGVNLSKNKITKLEPEMFKGMRWLQSVDLSDNQISMLPDYLFSNLPELYAVYLDKNQLSSIPSLSFVNLAKLMELELSNNQLMSLNADAFTNFPTLTGIYLENNQLASISPTQFQGLVNLKRLNLSKNPLTALSEDLLKGLAQLETLSLSNTRLTELSYNFLIDSASSLKSLILEQNLSLEWMVPHYFCPRGKNITISIKGSPKAVLGYCPSRPIAYP